MISRRPKLGRRHHTPTASTTVSRERSLLLTVRGGVNTVDGDAAVGAPLPGDRDEPVRLRAGVRDRGRGRFVARVVEAMELVVDDDAVGARRRVRARGLEVVRPEVVDAALEGRHVDEVALQVDLPGASAAERGVRGGDREVRIWPLA